METNIVTKVEEQYLIINKAASKELNIIARWGKTIAYLSVFGALFILIMGVFAFEDLNEWDRNRDKVGESFLILLFVIIYMLPFLALYMFSRNIKGALKIKDPDMVASAFSYLKIIFMLIGGIAILLAIVILITIVID